MAISTASKPPVREQGVVTNQPAVEGLSSGSQPDEAERNPKLTWPSSIERYEEMLNDSQIQALRAVVTLPQKRRRWLIDPNGSDPRIVRHVADDLGLPVKGEDAGPRRVNPRRFSWGRHLHHVLLAPFFGHYFFSQFAPIDDRDGLNHLRKLMPLPPRTIQEIRTAPDGGLEWIRQYTGKPAGPHPAGLPKEIPVTALVGYIWEQEAGNWLGQSLLRAVYRDWLSKDDLIRGNLTKLRRTGMGIPVAESTTPEGDRNLPAAQAVAQAWRAGEEASAGMPHGTRVRLLGVEGTVPDHVPSIKLHDEAMARRFLAMIIQLGQTEHGSRALGEDFVDLLAMFHDTLAVWIEDTTTLHVIRDIVDWSYGEEIEEIPLLVSERNEEPELAVADMVSLIDKGALSVDGDFEDFLRGRYRLPARKIPRPVDPAATTRAARLAREAATATAPEIRLPDRPLRREPLPQEVAAAIDFDALELLFEDGVAGLTRDWQEIRQAQIDELHDLIAATDDLAALADVSATPAGVALLVTRMRAAAQEGIAGALEEAHAQGATITAPDVDDLMPGLEARAEATAAMLARALSEAASRRALAVAGTVLDPVEVAANVRGHLELLKDSWLEDQFNGLLVQSVNGGRRATMRVGIDQLTAVYASELLDASTCSQCADEDGTQYATLEEAERAYPTGGHVDCLGGPRCRGTLVAVYGEAPATVQ